MSGPVPEKAVHLKPGRRTLRRKKRGKGDRAQWEEHRGESALDAWGTAIRDMRAAGTWPEEGN